MDLMGLPCQRGRHDACSGVFTLGVATFRRQHECICSCHFVAKITEQREYARHLSQRRIQLLPS